MKIKRGKCNRKRLLRGCIVRASVPYVHGVKYGIVSSVSYRTRRGVRYSQVVMKIGGAWSNIAVPNDNMVIVGFVPNPETLFSEYRAGYFGFQPNTTGPTR